MMSALIEPVIDKRKKYILITLKLILLIEENRNICNQINIKGILLPK